MRQLRMQNAEIACDAGYLNVNVLILQIYCDEVILGLNMREDLLHRNHLERMLRERFVQ